ncbi:hypothetical protein AMATHDRAFT_69024 [Amanita thiersii Skay4041]|uniref:G-alpha-domain-containing protein n=1 Tax=Amanita thiersii Skay4041 TaxID=703135 RepID=A0A2A9NGG0_9AGAR|nr:hypothetical protein AMATHDRAFT_69024 [Amanita thiersii Skay4041]
MPIRVRNLSNEMDPLTHALLPPPDETTEQREARLHKEREAKLISDNIDEQLAEQKLAERRSPKAVKILLLGQSESGKSTTLKNFQLMYEPKAFRNERASWRAVIQLNVVRSFHLILDAVDRSQSMEDIDYHIPPISPDLLKLKMRLSPLLQVEETLLHRLTPLGSGETEATQFSYADRPRALLREIAVNSATQWKDAFNRWKLGPKCRESIASSDIVDWDDPNDPGAVLHACSEDMIKLWNDTDVRELLRTQNMRLEELAGFFLDSLERVTSLRYVPTDDDILRARLKTLGVTEHRFRISAGSSLWRDWRIFDVGGHRSQVRAAWAPYFDDMAAIIFLAPISCFDQVLAEDPTVNRLEDSVHLWKSIVSNKLLQYTNLILFLNKIDILHMKLAAGIKLADFVVSYGDRPNDFDNVSAYLRRKFAGILKECSPTKRIFYCHLTTVTDTKSTKLILSNLREMVMRTSLEQTSLIN